MNESNHFAFNFSSTEGTQTTEKLITSNLSSISEPLQDGKFETNKKMSINPNLHNDWEKSPMSLNLVPLGNDTESNNSKEDDIHSSVPFDVIPLRGNDKLAAQSEDISLPTPDIPNVLRRVRLLDPNRLAAIAGDSIQKSDLIPGIYEGGLKMWECSIDLCRFLYELYSTNADTDNRSNDGISLALGSNGTTLELGCGHGLPGIMVSLLGASSQNKVLFSDYNDYVLKYCTLRNLFLNTPQQFHEDLPSRVALVSGDWLQLSNLLLVGHENKSKNSQVQEFAKFFSSSSSTDFGRFDLILAAETTYTESSARDTATLISRHLKFDTGVALVATKRYYFGVGGGSDCFRRFTERIKVARCELDDNHKLSTIYTLQSKTVKVIDDGNIREILQITLEKILK